MQPIFYDRKGEQFARIENGKSLFDARIAITSTNGKYFAVAGYWYINDENSENDGDEIEGSAEAIVFENDRIAYRVKGIDVLDDDAVIRNDGRLCIYDGDDTVSVWSKTEKTIKKKFAFSWLDYGITTDYVWAYGDGEDGNLRLSVFLFESGRMWTKRLHTDICCIKTIYMQKDRDSDQNCIIAIAETYDDKDIFIKYDIDGKKQELTKNEIVEIEQLSAMQESHSIQEPQPTDEDAETNIAASQKKKIPRWVIIVAIVAIVTVILALIGKNVQP